MIQYKNLHVTVFESALFRTTSTVVQTKDLVLVADPNWLPGEVGTIRQQVENVTAGRPVFLLFTHSDYDHIIGYGAFPGTKTIASAAFARNPEKEEIIEQIRTWDDENYIVRPYPIHYPAVEVTVAEDGQTFELGETKLTFYLAPGHNADGIFTILETTQPGFTPVWLAGDYLCEVEFPYIYHSSTAYEQTLGKVDLILEKHAPALLVPGHGDVAVSDKDILQRKKEALDYIREMRACIAKGIDFDTEKLWKRYRFRRGMEKFHRENVLLFEKEFRKGG
ncbi:MAG: MBL fold metallo-hydrolase [Saprospiraceae bacterium]